MSYRELTMIEIKEVLSPLAGGAQRTQDWPRDERGSQGRRSLHSLGDRARYSA
jgi:hypothetical protein